MPSLWLATAPVSRIRYLVLTSDTPRTIATTMSAEEHDRQVLGSSSADNVIISKKSKTQFSWYKTTNFPTW